MFIALAILLGVVSLCPLMLVIDLPILPDIVPVLLAVGLVVVSIRLEPTEMRRFWGLTWPFVIASAVLGAWILLQMVPLSLWLSAPFARISELAHPVWTSAAAGVPSGVAGSITVDIGATAIAFVRYLGFVGIVLLSTALTIDRERAELLLVGLTIATGLTAAIVAVTDLAGGPALASREDALVCVAIGVSLSAATIRLVLERQAEQRLARASRWPILSSATLAGFAIFALCLAVIVAAHSGSLLFATAGGFGTFGAVLLVRRLDLGRWGASALGLTGLVAAVALVTGAAGNSTDLRLAFVRKGAAALDLTQRILADAPLVGDGAGTWGSMLAIYQPPEPEADTLQPVTAAARLSIEMGRPLLGIILLLAVLATGALLRGAANRHRDFFYPAAGAAGLVTLIILSFITVGVLSSVVALLAGALLGLALAQSQSRSTF